MTGCLLSKGGAAQRVFALMDSLPDIDLDAGRPVSARSVQGSLKLARVHFSYQMRPDHRVLEDISLSIPAGSTCALVGKSGGGEGEGDGEGGR